MLGKGVYNALPRVQPKTVGGDFVGYIIETKNLTKKYGEFAANKDINLQIEEGEVRAIIGETARVKQP